MTREELLKLCVDHIAAHSCVSSCCGAQPSAGEAKQLAECLRRRFSDDTLEQPHADKVMETELQNAKPDIFTRMAKAELERDSYRQAFKFLERENAELREILRSRGCHPPLPEAPNG